MSSIFDKKESMAKRMEKRKAQAAKDKAAMKSYWASKEGKKNVKATMSSKAPKGYNQHGSRAWSE